MRENGQHVSSEQSFRNLRHTEASRLSERYADLVEIESPHEQEAGMKKLAFEDFRGYSYSTAFDRMSPDDGVGKGVESWPAAGPESFETSGHDYPESLAAPRREPLRTAQALWVLGLG